jgi:hypothetical protein
MGLARISIAVLAVVVAFGLLVIGGIALWGALTNKDGDKTNAVSPSPSHAATTASAGKTRPTGSTSRIGNTVEIHCLAVQCTVFVAGPTPNDVQFNGNLTRDERRIFNETRLTVFVQDASTVTVMINGTLQPRGRREAKTYEVPASQ